MAASEAPAAGTSAATRHGWRIFTIWIVLSLAADLVIWFVWYPHLPPGRLTDRPSTSSSTSPCWPWRPPR